MNKSRLFASIKRGFTFAGMNALASAGYSKSVVEALEHMDDTK
ncbi:hypothetical protein ACOI8O_05785 [Bifidobacterium adolescentis]